ncbi:MAG: hypothetical protein HFE78_02305 [Clostridiales bacterium]|nr:hypothetical protein [Clostridiales bacterium]
MKLPLSKYHILKMARKNYPGKRSSTAAILLSCTAVCLFLCMSFLCFAVSHENANTPTDTYDTLPQPVSSPAWTEKQEETTAPSEEDEEINDPETLVTQEPVIEPFSSSLDWSFVYDEISDEELTLLAQLIQGEAGSSPLTQKAAIVWVVFNRIDNGYGDLTDVVTGGAFHGWGEWQEASEENKMLAKDVYIRWQAEKAGFTEVGRIIPPNCCHFSGNGMRNLFRVGGLKGEVWDFRWQSPYNS